MSRSSGSGNHRLLLAATASLLLGLGCAAASASAATTAADCGNLQTQLNAARAGDVVVLSGLCKGSYTLPSAAAFTLEGAPETTSGFAGANPGHPELKGSPVAGLTLAHLTFENSTIPTAEYSSALDLFHEGGTLTVAHDSFMSNTGGERESPATIREGQFGCSSATGSLVVQGSSFVNNNAALAKLTNPFTGGGALRLVIQCGEDPTALAGNTFSGNTVSASSGDGAGGALFLAGFASTLTKVEQTDNLFEHNSVSASGTSADYGGGGEWSQGVSLQSTGDRFIANTLPGTSGSGNWSWGAGLSILNPECGAGTAVTQSALSDDVLAANTIEDRAGDQPTDAQGAALYVGCEYSQLHGNHLTLLDSTVSGNAVTPEGAGAVAGIDGHSIDQLVLGNTILAGNEGALSAKVR